MIQELLAWVFPQSPNRPNIKEQTISVAASFISMLVICWVSKRLLPSPGGLVLVASMGAASLLVLVLPNSPLAQPYPLIMGHLVPTFVGVSVCYVTNNLFLAASLTVSLGLAGMYITQSMHPPGGAAALVPVIMGNQAIGGYEFLIYPVLLNVLTLIVIGIIINRYILKKDYPITPIKKDNPHLHNDPSPLERLGIRASDIESAIKTHNAFLNITTKDLDKIYDYAQMNAYARNFGAVRCKDIMSKDLITVEYGTSLEDAWALLRHHKVKILPVVDKANRVIGVLSLVDYLKRADLKTYHNFAEKLVQFVRKSPTIHTNKPEAVGQIMAHPPITAHEDALISTLVPLLSDKGLHHLPIVDSDNKLTGIVTQSDLIAALYQGAIQTDKTPDADGSQPLEQVQPDLK